VARTIAASAMCAVAALSIGCATSPRSGASSPLTLSIVGTNDLHGAVLSQDGRGGLALLGGFLQNLRAARQADGGGVLLLDAGDLFQGTLESNLNEGAVVVAAYNALGYAASAIGNHEFDFGPAGPAATPQQPDDDPRGALKARAAEARFPFLAANLVDASSGRPVDWPNVHPSAMVTVAGIHVGIVGLETRETLSATIAANTHGLSIAPLAPALAAEATRLRAAGATVVVATAHAGGRCTSFDNPRDLTSCAADEEIFQVARALPRGLVDVIVAGHRHNGIAHEVSGVDIISSYSSGRAFGRVDLSIDRATGRVQKERVFPPYDVCTTMRPDGAGCVSASDAAGVPATYEGRPVAARRDIADILAPAVAQARAVKETPLGAVIDEPLVRSGTAESTVGNLVADWTRAIVPRADLAIANGGGLRADLSAGTLTYGRLYEVMPFDNREAVITLSGADLRRVIAENLQRAGSVLILSGVRAVARCAGTELRVDVRRESGDAVRDDETLTVATSDFLATGGDEFFTSISPRTVEGASETEPVLRDQIAGWLRSNGGHWNAAGLLSESNRRLVYPGSRPVNCSRARN
jgi:5'-nucleotidase